MNYAIVIYFFVLNLIGFIIMWKDKRAAIKKRWRIKESTIFLISFLGGGLGILAGMKVFRHKTKHNKFIYGIPLILALQILVCIFFNQIEIFF